MKTLFLAFAVIFLVVGLVQASPYLVCDPQAGVTSYNVTGQSFAPTVQPAQPDGSIRMDVGSSPVGTTNLVINACKEDPIWGRSCSTTVPFALIRPAPADAPTGSKLVQ